MSWARGLTSGAILLGLGVGLYLALTPHPDLVGPPRAGPAPSSPEVTARGAKLAHYDERGHKVWELLASSLEVRRAVGDRGAGPGDEVAVAREVTFRVFDDSDKQEGEPILEVQAPKLTFFRSSGDLLLEGGVLARTREGLGFRAERMRWDAERERLTSQDRVRITQDGNLLEGVGFEYSPREGRLTILKAHLILVPRARSGGAGAGEDNRR